MQGFKEGWSGLSQGASVIETPQLQITHHDLTGTMQSAGHSCYWQLHQLQPCRGFQHCHLRMSKRVCAWVPLQMARLLLQFQPQSTARPASVQGRALLIAAQHKLHLPLPRLAHPRYNTGQLMSQSWR